ncbi:MAG: glycerate kinase [Epulopiscium sp. Nuni2H_MBin003]|nr:MAG: glycerate kinase [Epulopiscium sp. Nuni2H_MBin003]
MKVVIAIDSFKGSISSIDAGNAVKAGVLTVYKDAIVDVLPLADGGEGTVETLVLGMNGTKKQIQVTGPLIDMQVMATYGVVSGTVIVEMAQAAGLPIVPEQLRNPLNTTTYGVGEIIKNAIEEGYRNFIIGIGGSATTDAGIGMLSALGFEFYDKYDNLVGAVGKDLANISRIGTTNILPELSQCKFKIACDVNNPLYGKNGAAYIYGPQKGATEEIVIELDNGLQNFASVVKKQLGKDIAKVAGTGAAGGLGYAFLVFLDAKLESGSDIIIEEIALEDRVKDADFVITGEGRLDAQTIMGKAPAAVTKIAKKYGIKTLAFAGCITDDAVQCNQSGIDAFFPILPRVMSLADAMDVSNAQKHLTMTTIQVFNLIGCLK